MKKFYSRPNAEYVKLLTNDIINNSADLGEVGEGEIGVGGGATGN